MQVNARNRLTTENGDLQRQVRELETNYGAFSKNRGQLQSQLDDAKAKLEEEIRVPAPQLSSMRWVDRGLGRDFPVFAELRWVDPCCLPCVGLTRGFGRDFSVFGGLRWVGSTTPKV